MVISCWIERCHILENSGVRVCPTLWSLSSSSSSISSSKFCHTEILRHRSWTQNWPNFPVSSVVFTFATLCCRTKVKCWQTCFLQLRGTQLPQGLSSSRLLRAVGWQLVTYISGQLLRAVGWQLVTYISGQLLRAVVWQLVTYISGQLLRAVGWQLVTYISGQTYRPDSKC